ncbi:unnamed protein product [Mycetohabitans rhizoxinica HKI 454]|uniref:Uncharacterized protein n=1 Tax=Mycetohabitans rhizoxinica (strain DSM 19002 / CIP 109453 / HKI 454) TaxID=882378 RepID=E5AMR2_MYCRK|nr:unnamed protein product [Mycetohabitans rhizoxinica HKI 454]
MQARVCPVPAQCPHARRYRYSSYPGCHVNRQPCQMRGMLTPARRDDDPLARMNQRVHDIAADEPGRAKHYNAHVSHDSPPEVSTTRNARARAP